MKNKLLSLLLPIALGGALQAQVSIGGTPPGFTLPSLKTVQVVIPAPDLSRIQQEDALSEKEGLPWRIAVSTPARLNTHNSGSWSDIGRGEKIWQLKIHSKGAKAIAIYYDRFFLPEGGRLFLYNEDHSKVIGAFTSANNPQEIGNFATEMIHGETVTLEYFQPAYVRAAPIIEIGQIAYVYRGVPELQAWKVNESDACEVNVNCSEGASWVNQKRSVAKIVLKQGLSSYLCTGFVINNTAQDGKPYFLTAEHCGVSSSTSDYNQWVFYFNYEASGCSNPSSAPASQTITGCVKRASAGDGGGDTGSDFKLLEFNSAIPSSYNVYHAGWDRGGSASPSGVGIHHPSGDIKKISTYTSSLTSTSWGGTVPNTHWRVVWAATANGHGVTEGGSSGSPIFDNNGRAVGTLTGGGSYCTATSSPDSYGKFSYGWTSNGTTSDRQLKPWLDPGNTGVTTLNGAYLSGTTPSYCTSKGNSVADEWIQSVAVGSFTKNSGSNGGYANFTADKISLEKGKTYSFTLTPGFSSTAYNEYWKIWIDYNKDYDFDDAGELVYDAGAVSSSARTGSFTVPSGATVQETRMRISMKYNGAQTSCETFSYGEVEDYTANIIDPVTTTCNTPTGVNAGSVTSSSFTVSWTAVSGASSYEVNYKATSASTWQTATVTTTSYSVTGLSASTSYDYRVKTNCSSSSSAFSATQSVTTSPATVTYCTSRGNSTADEWIKTVKIGTINNTSNNNNGYGNYTHLSTNLEIGEGTAVTLTPGFNLIFTYPEYWRVWIDLNGDGDFTDTGELAYSLGGTSTGVVNGTVTVPAGITPRTTRMRVQMKYNAAPTSCETFGYGEVEDYTVNLVDTRSALVGNTFEDLASFDLFPNPADNKVTLQFTAGGTDNTIELMDITGKVLGTYTVQAGIEGALITHSIDLEAQPAGLYLVRLRSGHTVVKTAKLTVQ